MASSFIRSQESHVGLNHVPAYQTSGTPFATGSIDATSANTKIEFPYVSRWFEVINTGPSVLKVGFSDLGLTATNYFEVPVSGSTGRIEIKVSEIHLRGGGANTTSVVAGLTSILPQRVNTDLGTSWSGSVGVG
jgi:hypothetical protein|tara:strand:- start:1269 stop:1670 length:402 start_codon:yes stop_codon:yes gene_type:complete